MDVLYYSNYCKHSQTLINTLSRSNIKSKFYYVCIDKRTQEGQNTIIILENGNRIILPKIIKNVPSLLLPNHGNRVLTGGEILTYIEINNSQATNPISNDEPSPFALNSNVYDNISSDKYSFLDMTDEDLSAKGTGGVRQMHNYVQMDMNPLIATPTDDYEPDKISSQDNSELETYMKEREKNMPKHQTPYQHNTY
jgi:hypothetical protein